MVVVTLCTAVVGPLQPLDEAVIPLEPIHEAE